MAIVHYLKRALVGSHKYTGQICLREKPSVSDLESSRFGRYICDYPVQSVHAPVMHRLDFSYVRAGITIGRINALLGESPHRNARAGPLYGLPTICPERCLTSRRSVRGAYAPNRGRHCSVRLDQPDAPTRVLTQEIVM